jgi:hypothetical protein
MFEISQGLEISVKESALDWFYSMLPRLAVWDRRITYNFLVCARTRILVEISANFTGLGTKHRHLERDASPADISSEHALRDLVVAQRPEWAYLFDRASEAPETARVDHDHQTGDKWHGILDYEWVRCGPSGSLTDATSSPVEITNVAQITEAQLTEVDADIVRVDELTKTNTVSCSQALVAQPIEPVLSPSQLAIEADTTAPDENDAVVDTRTVTEILADEADEAPQHESDDTRASELPSLLTTPKIPHARL